MFRVLDEHGRDAPGAERESRLVEGDQKRWRAGYSYLASNDPRVVGLGKETAVRDVTVKWPDGNANGSAR